MRDEWINCTLGDIITLQRGMDLPSQNRRNGKIPIIASNGIVGYHDEAAVKGPGVVIGRSGSIGGGQYVTCDFWPLNTTLWVKDFKGNNPLFCYYLLRSIDFKTLNVGSGVPTLNRNHLHPMPSLLPPLKDQIWIANLLGSLDRRIKLLNEINTTLDSIAQALFKSWFIDFDPVHAKAEGREPEGMDAETAALFPDSFEESELGLIPKGWRIGILADCCQKIESGGTPKRKVAEYWDGTIGWLTFGEVRNTIVYETKEKITQVGLKESSAKIWPNGTTVVAMYGATAGEVCLLAAPIATNQACCGLVPKCGTKSFLFLSTRRESHNLALKSSGSAQQNLNKGLISNHKIIIPPDNIINIFEGAVNHLFERWILNDKKIKTLANLRDLLLPRLLSGDLCLAIVENMESVL